MRIRVVEIPMDRFVVKIGSVEISVNTLEDLNLIIEKYGERETIEKDKESTP